MGKTVKCAYCGRERPIGEMTQGKIVYRTSKCIGGRWRPVVSEKVQWYCKDAPCHGYDQMAHEG